MPTGTLCAERNAIGNALAGDQTLCRRHLQGVAVLSLTLDSDGEVAAGETSHISEGEGEGEALLIYRPSSYPIHTYQRAAYDVLSMSLLRMHQVALNLIWQVALNPLDLQVGARSNQHD